MTGIKQIEIQRELDAAWKKIQSDHSVNVNQREVLRQKTSDILHGVGRDREWVLEEGQFRAILKPRDRQYRTEFDGKPHLTDWRFRSALALAAYLVLDK